MSWRLKARRCPQAWWPVAGLQRDEFPLRPFGRSRLEANYQANIKRLRNSAEGLDTGLVLAAFDARDGRVAGTNQSGQFLLGQVVFRSELDDQPRNVLELAQPIPFRPVFRAARGTACCGLSGR